MEKIKTGLNWRYPHLCLVCGVDSGPIRTFLIVVIGGFVLSSFFFLLWAMGTKRIHLKEENASLALEAEQKGR